MFKNLFTPKRKKAPLYLVLKKLGACPQALYWAEEKEIGDIVYCTDLGWAVWLLCVLEMNYVFNDELSSTDLEYCHNEFEALKEHKKWHAYYILQVDMKYRVLNQIIFKYGNEVIFRLEQILNR